MEHKEKLRKDQSLKCLQPGRRNEIQWMQIIPDIRDANLRIGHNLCLNSAWDTAVTYSMPTEPLKGQIHEQW